MFLPSKAGIAACSAILLSAGAEAFAPTGLPAGGRPAMLARQAAAAGSPATLAPLCGQASRGGARVSAGALAALSMSSDEGKDVSRRGAIALAPALLALSSLPGAADALPVPAKLAPKDAKAPLEAPGLVQHAVILAKDLDDEVEFWTKGLGMKELRSRTVKGVVTRFVGYGPESPASPVGGHFSLEITEGPRKADIGTGLQHLDLVLPPSTDRILKVEDAGGSVVPRWFGTADFIEVQSPSGYVARIRQAKGAEVDYPFKGLTLRTNDVALTGAFLKSVGMAKQGGGLLSGILGDGSETWTFEAAGGGGVGASVVLEPRPKGGEEVKAGNTLEIVLLCDDVEGRAAAAQGAGATVRFQGAFPGVGTKIAALEEPGTGFTVVLVDPVGFQKELPKAPPKPPVQKAADGA